MKSGSLVFLFFSNMKNKNKLGVGDDSNVLAVAYL